jgi:trk system potassium uptake protein TrkA
VRSIIVGSGRVGAGLASTLGSLGHEVTILDVRTDAFRRLDPAFPGQALRGDGTDEATLRRAGAEGADWFFALTNGDNRNVLAAQLAAETFGIAHVVAKVNDPVRAEAYALMGIHTLDRTSWMIDAIVRFMGQPGKPGTTDVRTADDGHAHSGPDHVRPTATADGSSRMAMDAGGS